MFKEEGEGWVVLLMHSGKKFCKKLGERELTAEYVRSHVNRNPTRLNVVDLT